MAAKTFFRSELQGKVVQTVIGPVHLTGASSKEMKRGMKADALKARLVASVPAILSTGKYDGKSDLYKNRTDRFIAFHFFEKEVEVGGAIVTAGVNVGERDNKVFEFSLSAYGLGHAGMPSWAKAKAHQTTPGTSQGPGGPNQVGMTGISNSNADLDAIVHEKDDSLNIFILKVVDKATGQRMTELEDDFAAPEAKPTYGV